MKGIIDSDVLSFDAKSRSYPGDIVRVICPNTKRVIMHHVNPRFVARHGFHFDPQQRNGVVGKLRDGLAQMEDVHIYCAENLPDSLALLRANARAMDPEDVDVILDKAADGEPDDHSCQSNAGSQECRQKNGSTRQ